VYGRSNFVVKDSFDLSVFSKQNLRTEIAPFRINNLGNRGPDMSREKPPGTFRAVFLGDSITFGYYVREDDSFVVQTGKALASLVSHQGGVEVMNAGVSSLNVHHNGAHLRHRALAWSPDLVVWNFYLNDIYDVGGKQADILFPIRRADWFKPLRFSAIGRLAESFFFSTSFGARVSVDLEHPVNKAVDNAWAGVESALAEAKELLQEQNIPLIVTIFPSGIQLSRPWTKPCYQERLSNICTTLSIPCIDFLEPIKKAGDVKDIYYGGDLIHPNARGHTAAAAALVSFLEKNPHFLRGASGNDRNMSEGADVQ
jgi:lysophospholipase L1-like esterase